MNMNRNKGKTDFKMSNLGEQSLAPNMVTYYATEGRAKEITPSTRDFLPKGTCSGVVYNHFNLNLADIR